MVGFYDELQPEEWPSYAQHLESEAVTLRIDKFLDMTFEATIVNLLNQLRQGHITTEELVYLEQEAATWFHIILD